MTRKTAKKAEKEYASFEEIARDFYPSSKGAVKERGNPFFVDIHDIDASINKVERVLRRKFDEGRTK